MTLEVASAREETFKAALGSFASGVNVITVRAEDGAPHGMTANAFSSVSMDPFLILICVNRDTRTYRLIRQQERFGVNILGSDGRDISDYCARAGQDKSLDPAWLLADATAGAPPALADALAYLDCSVHTEVPGGTHAVLLGEVQRIGTNDDHGEPLIYYRGRYHSLDKAGSLVC